MRYIKIQYMKNTLTARVLSAPEAKPWEMNGKSGVTYKVGIRFENEIFEMRTDRVYSDMIDKDVTFDIGLKKKDSYVQVILKNGAVVTK